MSHGILLSILGMLLKEGWDEQQFHFQEPPCAPAGGWLATGRTGACLLFLFWVCCLAVPWGSLGELLHFPLPFFLPRSIFPKIVFSTAAMGFCTLSFLSKSFKAAMVEFVSTKPDKREWPTLRVINLRFITLLVVKRGFKSTDCQSTWQWALAGSPEHAWVPSSCTGQHGPWEPWCLVVTYCTPGQAVPSKGWMPVGKDVVGHSARGCCLPDRMGTCRSSPKGSTGTAAW